MGSTSRYGQAVINPAAPEAVGVCDRCGKLYNLRVLRWQMAWRGTSVQNLHLRVCNTCYDIPNEQLRTLILPPDPMPVMDARTEPYTIDEKNFLTLSAIIGKPAMLIAEGEINCALESGLGIVTAFSDVSDMTAALLLGIGLTAPFSDADAMTAALLLGIGLTAPFSDAGAMTADLDVQGQPQATSTPTDSFSGAVSNTGDTFFTEVGASIGTAAADRIVVVGINGFIDIGNAPDAVTIGGIGASLIRQDTDGGGTGITQLWQANVPLGTTANIVVNLPALSSFISTFNCAVWAIYDAVSVGSSNGATVASGAVSASVTPGDGTTTLAVAGTGASSAPTTSSMGNITEDFDMSVDFTFYIQNSVFGSREDVSSPGSVSISANVVDEDISTVKVITIAVFAP